MNKLILGLLLCLLASVTQAATYKTHLPQIKTQQVTIQSAQYSQLSFSGVDTLKTVGAPELPVKIWLVQGTPAQIQVQLNIHQVQILKNTRPAPVQPQACRCDDDKKIEFKFDPQVYNQKTPAYVLNYLGAFRGTPVTQVQVNLGHYDSAKNQVSLITEADVTLNLPEYKFQGSDYKDYLIITPENLASGLTEFVDWKKNQGFNVIVETVLSPANDQAALAGMIAKHYQESGTDFVIIVGDEKTIPMYKVKTSGSSQTPTDLKYFTMDGGTDYIPDMFASRVAASTPEEVKAILAKSIEYSAKTSVNGEGWQKFIGVASNEGSNPSDNEYVLAIDEKFKAVMADAKSTHLYQNDSINSNPTGLNEAFNKGAFWMTYLGHGSGTSWPSMYRTYSTTDIKNIANQDVVKPVIIDVACMNGNLNKNMLGVSLIKGTTSAIPTGAAAYYGGTVNISWHPPAVMAQGIIFEHMDKKFQYLGEALMAGQMYLATKWSKKDEVIDNMEWYHLQGDPGMLIQF